LAEQDQLASMLAESYRQSGRTFYILLVRSLQGVSIEEFSEQVFNIWKIGQEKEDDGLLLVLAPNERKTQLEVGYGLEGDISDIKAKQYIVHYQWRHSLFMVFAVSFR
jgi:uncharacterized protein